MLEANLCASNAQSRQAEAVITGELGQDGLIGTTRSLLDTTYFKRFSGLYLWSVFVAVDCHAFSIRDRLGESLLLK
jgi:hypothetical protein